MLEHIWIIPALTFVSFWLIVFFGRRMRVGGAEIGLVGVGACRVLSSITAYQWTEQAAGLPHEPAVEAEHGEAVETDHSGPIESKAEHGEPEAAAEGEHAASLRATVNNDIYAITIGGLNI